MDWQRNRRSGLVRVIIPKADVTDVMETPDAYIITMNMKQLEAWIKEHEAELK